MKRNVYLNTLTLEEALAVFESKTECIWPLKTECVPVAAASGRITAEAVYAKCSNPNYNAAAMDGIAVLSHTVAGADTHRPIKLSPEAYQMVDTGDLMQKRWDSVVMIEDVEMLEDQSVLVRQSVTPWQHVRMVGEDFVIGEMLLPKFKKIKPADLGALISGGHTEVRVIAPIQIALIPTGDEIVPVGTAVKPGQIYESNGPMFAAMVTESGGVAHLFDVVPDQQERLKEALLKAVMTADLVVMNAGSSAGRDDYTAKIIRELGEVWVHGIDIKPGKPAILGVVQGKPVIGIPGYPVSAYMTFHYFVLPMISRWQRQAFVSAGTEVTATLSQAVVSSLKHKEFVRVHLGQVNGKLVATPLQRGAGATMSLVKAAGVLTIPKASEGYPAGAVVQIAQVRDSRQLDQTLVAIGSHDLTMDWICDLLVDASPEVSLSSSHVGSLGGVMALKRGEAHLAPIHLLDPQTGTYNIQAVQKYFKGQKMYLLSGIERQQGFYSRKGENADMSFEKIQRDQLVFLNRQRGSGTRILTDYLLGQAGIDTTDIMGYDTEVGTHTALALGVKVGNAHTGIGIESVARAMDLDYFPLGYESYEFLLPETHLRLDAVQAFIEVLKSPRFREKLNQAGGYRYDRFKILEINDSEVIVKEEVSWS